MERIYKGVPYTISQDTHAENPFEAWDGQLPLLVESGNFAKSYKGEQIFDYIRSKPTEGQLILHQKAILEIFEEEFDQGLSKDEKLDFLDNLLSDLEGRNFNILESLCILFKIPHINITLRGYVQSSWADVFLAYTPKWAEESGCKTATYEQLKANADLYGSWAFGDVYGYSIDHKNLQDSCFGFYGDIDKSGLIEEAEAIIDYMLNQNKISHFSKVKSWIKNKVPFQYRSSFQLV